MNGTILSPYFTKILGRHRLKKNKAAIEKLFFSILMNNEAHIFRSFINEENYKTFDKLIEYGVVKIIPDKFYSHSFTNFGNLIELKLNKKKIDAPHQYEDWWRALEYYDEHDEYGMVFFEDDDDNHNAFQNFYKEMENEDLSRIEKRGRIREEFSILTNKIFFLLDFICSFRESKRRVSTKAIDDFARLQLNDNFLEVLNLLFKNIKREKKNDARAFSNIKNSLLENYDFIQKDFIYDQVNDLENITSLDEEDEYFDEKFYKRHSNKIYQNIREFPKLKYFEDVLSLFEANVFFNAAMKYSSENNIIINSDIIPVKEKIVKGNSYNDKKYSNYDVYKIVLEEMGYPIIDSLDSFLRLRENKKVSLFKKNVNLWKEALNKNELKELPKLKTHLQKANQAITTVEQRAKRSSLEFYITLSLELVGALTFLPLSLIPTSYSGAIKIDSYLKKKKYDWLILDCK